MLPRRITWHWKNYAAPFPPRIILPSRRTTAKTIGQLFGFYLKLTRGAFCNAGVIPPDTGRSQSPDPKTLAQPTEVFSQELLLSLLEGLFSELLACSQLRVVPCTSTQQYELAQAAIQILHGSVAAPPHLEGLDTHFAELHRQLSDYIRRKFIYEEPVSIPITTIDLEAFKRIIQMIKKIVPALGRSQFTALLDEYENLFPFQKVVVNTLVKLGPPDFTIKIGKKVGTAETSGTTSGQELQEIHDYNRIRLVYAVDDDNEFANYLELLQQIVSQLLTGQSFTLSNVSAIFPIATSEEVAAEDVKREILKLLKVSEEEFDCLTPDEKRAKCTYYRDAATLRLIYGRPGVRSEKRYCGFRELAFLSSGVIRYFQEIAAMAYYLEYGSGKPPDGMTFSPENQSRAVHIVSRHNLTTLIMGDVVAYVNLLLSALGTRPVV